MPVYSYICKDCGNKFDLLLGVVSKKEARVCKKCGSRNIEKTFALFGVGVPSGKGGSNPPSPNCPTGTCPTCY